MTDRLGVTPESSARPGVPRRSVLRGALRAGTAAAAAVATSSRPGAARATPALRRFPAPRGGKDVAIFGGGMAGLSAAHELIERGYRVTVYEPAFLGGKARSLDVPGTGAGGRRDLPGEHGFRFFPGCYQHVPDTMARIPFGTNSVRDNLVRVAGATIGLRDRPPIFAPVELAGIRELTPELVRAAIESSFSMLPELPPHELAFFAKQSVVWFTSCTERRFGQWEYVSWESLVRAEGKSSAYRDYLVNALTRITVAAKPHLASARTIGTIGEALMLAGSGLVPEYSGGVDRILNGPTNEVWIDPWVDYLRSRGVRFVLGAGAVRLNLRAGRVVSVTTGGADEVAADWFVCAIPPDKMAPLLTDEVVAAEPRLSGLRELRMDWMVGLQFYLKRPTDLPEGHIAAMGTPWAITALRQAPMWVGDFAAKYGDGTVVECLSADISDWDTPGILFGKPAKRCGKQEVFAETWAQLKRWLNTSTNWLRDEDIHSWHLDPGVTWSGGSTANDTPLLVNTVGSYDHRPDAACAIPNLFLGGDHVRTHIDLATMEGANESGRAVANAIMDAADDPGPRAPIFPLVAPAAFEPAKRVDAERYRAGLPHLLEV